MGSAVKSIGAALGGGAAFGLGGLPAALGGAKLGSNIAGAIAGEEQPGGPQGINLGDMAGVGALRQEQQYLKQHENEAKLGEQLSKAALGQAPSLAEAQLKAATDRTLAQQLAAARANRAVNPALAARQAALAGAAANQQTAQAAGIQKVQEQMANQREFADYLRGLKQAQQGFMGINAQTNAQQAQTDAARSAADKQLMGSMIGSGASILGMAATGGASKAAPIAANVVQSQAAPSSGYLGANTQFNYSRGGVVKGKEVVKKDSNKNDVVPAMLSAGELVVPKSAVKKGPDEVKKFAEHLLSKKVEPKKEDKKVEKGFAAVLVAQKELNDKIEEIAKKYKGGK